MQIAILHDKIPPSLRMTNLTPLEVSKIEDMIVDLFIENDAEISKIVLADHVATKQLKDVKDRVRSRESTIAKIRKELIHKWGPRSEKELESLSSLCVSRFWILTEAEMTARDEMRVEESMIAKQTIKPKKEE